MGRSSNSRIHGVPVGNYDKGQQKHLNRDVSEQKTTHTHKVGFAIIQSQNQDQRSKHLDLTI